MTTKINLELTVEQARSVSLWLELLTRIGLGQFEFVEELLRDGTVPVKGESQSPRGEASLEQCDMLKALLNQVKVTLGYSPNGNHGIVHLHNHINATRAYETNKVRQQAVAPATHSSEGTVLRDGLTVRYTQDPVAKATLIKENEKNNHTPVGTGKFNRAYDFAFEVLSDSESGDDVSHEMLRLGLLQKTLTTPDLRAVCGNFDTHEE